ncbi:MAG: TVP38/TMEM64 family protein [Myxococcaceae bacterium]|nr:TVP38/TMEM64 family protein [Myxococcaceae bacterium]
MREKSERRARLWGWLKILGPVLASIAGLTTLRLLGPDILDRETLRHFLEPLGPWAPVVFVVLLGIRPITLLPGQLFTAVGGILFGVLFGSLYALLGSLLSFALVFVLSRRFGTRFMKRFAGEKYHALAHTARRHDFKVAALATINPLIPTDVLVVVAAASGARFWPTALGVLLGTMPGTFLTAQFGAALGTGRTIMTIVSAAGLIVSMVLGVFLGRKVVTQFNEAAEQSPGTASPPGRRSARLMAETR